MTIHDFLEPSDELKTIDEWASEHKLEKAWLSHLDSDRARLAQQVLAHGLTGELQIHNGYEFRWLNGQTILADSGRRKTYLEAFDTALNALPYKY
jgi:hypothetical protein